MHRPTAVIALLSLSLLAAPPAAVYDALTGHIAHWWDPEHTFSGDAANLSLDPTPGGCFCEALPNGGIEAIAPVVDAVLRSQLLRLQSYVETGKPVRQ